MEECYVEDRFNWRIVKKVIKSKLDIIHCEQDKHLEECKVKNLMKMMTMKKRRKYIIEAIINLETKRKMMKKVMNSRGQIITMKTKMMKKMKS